MLSNTYSAGLMSQSFWFVEMKKVVGLVSNGCSDAEIKSVCVEENLFGAAKEYRAKRMCGYILNRAKQLDETMIDMFLNSDVNTQKIINLIAILMGDRLFFEFMFEVYREKVILGIPTIEDADLRIFFSHKEDQSDVVEAWKDTTKRHLQTNYMTYLADAGLITVVDKKRTITPPILDMSLEEYLNTTENAVIVKAITGVN